MNDDYQDSIGDADGDADDNADGSADDSAVAPSKVLCQGLTEEERREIRNCQRSLRKEIPNLAVSEAMKRNNEIHERVRYIRESVLDAENLQQIVKQASETIQTIQVPRYDTDKIIRKLKAQGRVAKRGKWFFDWAAYGKEASKCFSSTPSYTTFLNGPLVNGDENKALKAKQRAIREEEDTDEVQEEQPLEIQGHTPRDSNTLSAVEENIQTVQQTLVQKVKQTYDSNKSNIGEDYGGLECIPKRIKRELRRNKDVCAVELLFDPTSFTQTVENMYHYSFLVKDGKASLKVRDETFLDKKNKLHPLKGGPVANSLSNKTKTEPTPQPRQAIVSLTMENWKSMIEAYNVKKSHVEHRENLS